MKEGRREGKREGERGKGGRKGRKFPFLKTSKVLSRATRADKTLNTLILWQALAS